MVATSEVIATRLLEDGLIFVMYMYIQEFITVINSWYTVDRETATESGQRRNLPNRIYVC